MKTSFSTLQNRTVQNKKAIEFGRLAHKLLAEHLYSNPRLAEVPIRELTKEEAQLLKVSVVHPDSFLINALKLLKTSGFKRVYFLKGKPVIEFYLTNNWLHGYVDLVFLTDKNKLVLLDWKTTSKAYSLQDVKDSKQLRVYAWLLKKYGVKVDYLAYAVLEKKTGKTYILRTRNSFSLGFIWWLFKVKLISLFRR